MLDIGIPLWYSIDVPQRDTQIERMIEMKIQELKKGDYFTISEISHPKENQLYVFEGYDRSQKRYCAVKFSDMCFERVFKKDTEVYTDFIF